jgi:hypothetical protein
MDFAAVNDALGIAPPPRMSAWDVQSRALMSGAEATANGIVPIGTVFTRFPLVVLSTIDRRNFPAHLDAIRVLIRMMILNPSMELNNGVRYRFYVSSALLRGRKADVGSVGRVSAEEIESAVLTAVQPHQGREEANNGLDPFGVVGRVVISRDQLMLTIVGSHGDSNMEGVPGDIKIRWSTKAKDAAAAVESDGAPDGSHNEALIWSIVRAHVWMHSLREGTYDSVEDLADVNRMHAKVVRQALRLAFLSPEVTSAVLEGRQPAGLVLAQTPSCFRCIGQSISAFLGEFRRSNIMNCENEKNASLGMSAASSDFITYVSLFSCYSLSVGSRARWRGNSCIRECWLPARA